MARRTKSTMAGWTKIGKNKYRHVDGHEVRKVNFLWEVSGPNKNDGHRYSTLWVAMDAAAKTPARFVNGRTRRKRNPDVRLHWTQRGHTAYFPSGHGKYGMAAWWRTGLKKPKDVRKAVQKAHKYALKQKDWVKHHVTVEGNPYGYIIAGRTRPHAYSATRDFPYKDRSEAKRVIGERVRAMGRRGDDVAFDAFLTEPRGRKIGKTRILVSGYARNPIYHYKRLLRPRARNASKRRFGRGSSFPMRTFGVWMSGGKTRTVKAHTANEAAAKAAGGPVIGTGGSPMGPMYFTSRGGRGNSIKVWPESKSGNPRRSGTREYRGKRSLATFYRGSNPIYHYKRRPRNAKGQFIKVKRKRQKSRRRR